MIIPVSVLVVILILFSLQAGKGNQVVDDNAVKEKARALVESTNRAFIAENQHAKVKTLKLL